MSDYQAFQVELKGNIAHVQINRPEKINAMNAAFWTKSLRFFSGPMRLTPCEWWCSAVRANTFRPVLI